MCDADAVQHLFHADDRSKSFRSAMKLLNTWMNVALQQLTVVGCKDEHAENNGRYRSIMSRATADVALKLIDCDQNAVDLLIRVLLAHAPHLMLKQLVIHCETETHTPTASTLSEFIQAWRDVVVHLHLRIPSNIDSQPYHTIRWDRFVFSIP